MTEAEAPDQVALGVPDSGRIMSRRTVLGAAATGAAGLVVGRLAGPLFPPSHPDAPAALDLEGLAGAYPFYGAHQAGITTPAQAHLQFAAFDMAADADRRDLIRLLRDWTTAAARMAQGLQIAPWGALGGDPNLPPDDTGEATDLAPSGLTITIGFGSRLFEREGADRFGIAVARPPELADLPPFPGDALDPAWSGGDLCLQVCADDPMVVQHAVRNLARAAFGRAGIRWSQSGFGQTPTLRSRPHTPRNLLGFKDGTANIRVDDQAALEEHVWLATSGTPAWLAGGTYLVIRRIRMLLEGWDLEPLAIQEATFGRAKGSGSPLSGGDESTVPDFAATVDGADAIDRSAHIRLAHPSNNGGIRLLRRGYNYLDGITPDGSLDGGLLFISYQRSPERFVTVQRALASDLLNQFIRPVGSALFVVPPGASTGGFVGDTLFG